MPRPTDAYREGYERGRKDSLGGRLAEVTMGMLRDDPGGHFGAGYHDGAAGKKFTPPSDEVRKPAAELNPFDDAVAIKTVCPNCGALDWFEWRFLGRLKDPICGHSWYVGSGTYTLMQIRAAFAAGGRFAKHLTSGVSGEGAWIAKALGWFMGVILGLAIRLEFGVLMIPVQAIVGLFQTHKTKADTVVRVVVITVFAVAAGIVGYSFANRARMQLQGKWYLVTARTPPHACSSGYEFLRKGRFREVHYCNALYVGGRDEAYLANEQDGYYDVTGDLLSMRFNGILYKESYRLVSVSQDSLILELGNQGYPMQFTFARYPSAGYSSFGERGTIPIVSSDPAW